MKATCDDRYVSVCFLVEKPSPTAAITVPVTLGGSMLAFMAARLVVNYPSHRITHALFTFYRVSTLH